MNLDLLASSYGLAWLDWLSLERSYLKALQFACARHHHVKLIAGHPATEYAQSRLHIEPPITR